MNIFKDQMYLSRGKKKSIKSVLQQSINLMKKPLQRFGIFLLKQNFQQKSMPYHLFDPNPAEVHQIERFAHGFIAA